MVLEKCIEFSVPTVVIYHTINLTAHECDFFKRHI